jgi:A/G-specific adenine glycosylase
MKLIQKNSKEFGKIYEFPLIETDKEEDFDFVAEQIQGFFKENISSILK